jgi:hypothetical protein
MNTNEILEAAAKQPTETLIGSLLMLEQVTTLSQAERLVKSVVSDVIEERHNLADAMDEIYADLDYTGTYTDALIAALAKHS